MLRQCFNSRTPGGVRLYTSYGLACEEEVSIHAPREGCDSRATRYIYILAQFQFTHPGRGATIHILRTRL